MAQMNPEVIARKLYGMTKREAQSKGICLVCKEEALPKCHSAAGQREYQLSGFCEPCFDNLFPEEE